jgi:hypothetical protein
MRTTRALRGLSLVLLLPLAACALTEVTLADPADLVVAEILLRAGESTQQAFLHRTLSNGGSLEVAGATIVVTNERGESMLFKEASPQLCLDDAPEDATVGTCYSARNLPFPILPASTYSIRIDLAGGGTLTGQTTVPGDFSMISPAPVMCHLDADRTIEIQWTRSNGSWVYVSETKIAGLRAALAKQGVMLEDEPARFLGLSISAQDTTLVFPSELGIFDRADPALADALLAIRDGLPADVAAEFVVAAADRNYVNWARGGQFNPSGVVQIPSLEGSGTGVFGSIVVQRRSLLTTESSLPDCN